VQEQLQTLARLMEGQPAAAAAEGDRQVGNTGHILRQTLLLLYVLYTI
jgi:hypothetical protein